MSQKHIFLFGNVYQRNRSKVTCESVVWPKLAYPLIPPDMKHPKSPDSMDDSVPAKCRETKEGEEEQEGRKTTVGHRAKRERRQGGSGGSSSATMCQVCNIQLNSSAQAQIHYRGKTHQRRLRRLAKVVSSGTAQISEVSL